MLNKSANFFLNIHISNSNLIHKLGLSQKLGSNHVILVKPHVHMVKSCPCRYSSTRIKKYISPHQINSNINPRFSTSISVKVKEDEENKLSADVLEEINDKVSSPTLGRLFAVVQISGKQRKITTEDIIVLDKPIEADIGEEIRLNKVLLVGGKDFTFIGRPVLNQELVKVEATVLEKTLSQTIISFWYRKRKDYRRMHLRKNFLTYLRISNIEINPHLK